jgi:aldose 1-epimerase
MTQAPSGEQFEIGYESQRATVVEVGGGIREYLAGDRPVLEPYDVGAVCDAGHGAPLIPWPNRLGDGRYTFDGVSYQLPLSEPGRHNAIHGLLRWRPWQLRDRTAARVVVGARLHPMAGYPFDLDVEIGYELGPAGLTVRTTATNVGDRAAPFGSGQHPYLSPGSGTVDGCNLRLDAATRVTTDAERQLPTGSEPVTGTAHDFREPRILGSVALDDAFTDLVRDGQGRSWALLTGVDGRTAALWVDESYSVLQVFTGDTLGPERRRRGLAAEPMTCPADAFRTGTGLIRLEPGATTSATWGALLR